MYMCARSAADTPRLAMRLLLPPLPFATALCCALSPHAAAQLLTSAGVGSASRPLGRAFGPTAGFLDTNTLQTGAGTGTLTVNPAAFGGGTGTGNFDANTFQNGVNTAAVGGGTGTGTGNFGANTFQNAVDTAAVGGGTGTGNFGANSFQNAVDPAAVGGGTGTGNFGANTFQNGVGSSTLTVNPAAVGGGTGIFGANTVQNGVSPAAVGGGTGASSNTLSSDSFGQSAATRSGTSNVGPPLMRVGPCRPASVFVDANYNTDDLFNENNGHWVVSMAPDTPENAGLRWAHARLAPASASSQRSTYQLTFYTQLQGEELKIGLQTILSDNPQSFVTTATTIPGQLAQQITYNVYYLGHSTGVWSYIYACSDQFGDIGVDYRALLNHGHPMTQQDLQTIRTIDARNRFRGSLFTVY